MPKYTFPNQRIVRVHRERPNSDFLGIKNDNWMAASRDLRPPALLLYLYLASNADNYETALSPAAVRQEIGMARSTYHDQFHILVDKGYLVPSHGNTFDFYEVPQPRPVDDNANNELSDGLDFTATDLPQIRHSYLVSGVDTEINNTQSKDNAPNIEEDLTHERIQQLYKEWEEDGEVTAERTQQINVTEYPQGDFVF